MRAVIILACLVLAPTSGARAQTESKAQAAERLSLANVPGHIIAGEGNDTEGVLKLIHSFQVALFVGDAKAFANLFTEDADFTNWRDHQIHGRENIYVHHVDVFKRRPATRTNNLLSYTVRFIRPDVVASEIKWDNKHARSAGGNTPPDRDGVWISVMTRENNTWYFKVVRNVMLNDGTTTARK